MDPKSDRKDEKTKLFYRRFKFKDFVHNLSFNSLVKYMYQPTDPASLGIIRFCFGLLMLIDLPEERGGAEIDIRWGDPRDCHFPLFPIMRPPGFSYMALLYALMWLGACGIMLGYKFRTSTLLFGIPYWYILLLDKSFWNNHSYLFGIITILLMGSSANHYFSLDGYLDQSKRNKHVPYWNYFILKFQFFLLYFLAGLKKTDKEWLEGYSMTNLGMHWVFIPFKFILNTDQIDHLVVHWFGFILDLTIGFWMLLELTRPIAMLFCACFHLMNSRLFSIGMFPYVCLATMPLFCEENWPRKIQSLLFIKSGYNNNCALPSTDEKRETVKFFLNEHVTWKHKIVVVLLLTHCGLQIFLPYSHFITKGFNNWTNGLYGYSWDMMVHSWDTILVVVKVVDNKSGNEHFLDPQAWTQNDRWSKHSDMCLQYANCLKDNLISDFHQEVRSEHDDIYPGGFQSHKYLTSENISIYIDVWCSLNGRFQQRMYDPNYDLLRANWSPFTPIEWLLPILSEYNDVRMQMNRISQDVYSWSNYSDVLFVADFPGLYLENFISNDLSNVTLTVLEGDVFYVTENELEGQSSGRKVTKGASVLVETGVFHRIHTVSASPSSYMYTYVNRTKELLKEHRQWTDDFDDVRGRMYSPFPLFEDISDRISSFLMMATHVYKALVNLLYDAEIIILIKSNGEL